MYRCRLAFAVGLAAIASVGLFYLPAYSQTGSRPGYIYDYAGIISDGYEAIIDDYVRQVDANTTVEIVI
jgi:hypothetical protein